MDGYPPVKRQRSMFRCDECRRRKLACEPKIRDFSKGEICEACQKRGLCCGPHRRYNDPVVAASASTSTSNPNPPLSPLGRRILPGPANANPRTHPSLSSQEDETAQLHSEDVGTEEDDLVHIFQPFPRLGSAQDQEHAHLQFSDRNHRLHSVGWSRKIATLRAHVSLVQNFRTRRLTIPTTSPIVESQVFAKHESAVDLAFQCACYEFAHLLEELFILVGSFHPAGQELPLRRLLECSRLFFQYPHTPNRRDTQVTVSHSNKVEKLHAAILEKLIHVCDSNGDTADADGFCHELGKLNCADALPHAKALRQREKTAFKHDSERMFSVFQHLELPTAYNPVPDASCNIFPAVNLAILAGRASIAQELRAECGVALHDHDFLKREALHVASERGEVKLAQDLIEEGPAYLGARDVFKMTPLHVAAREGDVPLFKVLLNAGANLKHRDILGRSLLTIAVDAGREAIVAHILEKLYIPDDDTLQIGTALFTAAARGHLRIVRLLLSKGVSPTGPFQGQTPRQAAVRYNHVEVALLLEKAEQTVNMSDNGRVSQSSTFSPTPVWPMPSGISGSSPSATATTSPSIALISTTARSPPPPETEPRAPSDVGASGFDHLIPHRASFVLDADPTPTLSLPTKSPAVVSSPGTLAQEFDDDALMDQYINSQDPDAFEAFLATIEASIDNEIFLNEGNRLIHSSHSGTKINASAADSRRSIQ